MSVPRTPVADLVPRLSPVTRHPPRSDSPSLAPGASSGSGDERVRILLARRIAPTWRTWRAFVAAKIEARRFRAAAQRGDASSPRRRPPKIPKLNMARVQDIKRVDDQIAAERSRFAVAAAPSTPPGAPRGNRSNAARQELPVSSPTRQETTILTSFPSSVAAHGRQESNALLLHANNAPLGGRQDSIAAFGPRQESTQLASRQESTVPPHSRPTSAVVLKSKTAEKVPLTLAQKKALFASMTKEAKAAKRTATSPPPPLADKGSLAELCARVPVHVDAHLNG